MTVAADMEPESVESTEPDAEPSVGSGGCSCRGRDLIAIFNGLHRSKKLRSRPAKKNISRK